MCRNVIASFLACHWSGKGSPHRQVHSSHSQLLPLGVAATKARAAASRGPVQAPLSLPSLDAVHPVQKAAGRRRLTAWDSVLVTKIFMSSNEIVKHSLWRQLVFTCASPLGTGENPLWWRFWGLNPKQSRVQFSVTVSVLVPGAAQVFPCAAHKKPALCFLPFPGVGVRG